jgi:hypothetical protein
LYGIPEEEADKVRIPRTIRKYPAIYEKRKPFIRPQTKRELMFLENKKKFFLK